MSLELAAMAVFWSAVGLVLYAHAGYPLVLFAGYGMVQFRRDWQYLSDRRE